MTAVEFMLPTLPPSKNALRIRTRSGIARSSKYKNWLDQFALEVMVQKVRNQVHGPYRLMFWATAPDKRRRDLANLLEALSDAMHLFGVTDDDAFAKRIEMEWVAGGQGIRVRVESAGVE